jgi:hypothetical protein
MDLYNKVELKRVWVEALRSGEYEQCKDTLHNLTKNSYCCLGVAAKVWGLATDEEMGVEQGMDGIANGEGPHGLYEELRSIMGLDVSDKGVEMNDRGKPFPLIADMIEADWNVTEHEQEIEE